MKRKIFRTRSLLPWALCAFLAADAFGAEVMSRDASSYDVDEIVVTASRRAENALALPYLINIRGMEDLQVVRQVRTIPDALRDLPGVMIQKTAHGQGSPYIRGFTGQRTLFLIDGIRLNNSTFREGPNQYWNTVDPLSAYRLELVQGPTSVLYGSDAIGGTVNAVSRSYTDTKLSNGFQWRMYARGASAENSVVLRPEVGYSGKRFDILAAISPKNFGDLEGGRNLGMQPKTGYDEKNAELKLNFELAENQRIIATVNRVNQDDAWRVHSTVFGKSWHGTTVGSDLRRSLTQERTLAYVQYRGTDLTDWLSDAVLSVSSHQQDEEQLRIRADGRSDVQGTENATTGIFGHVAMPSRIGTLTTGMEFYRDIVDSYRKDYNSDGSLRAIHIQGPVADDATYTTSAAFVQDQIEFAERTELTLGLRYTQSRADARGVQDPNSGERIRIKGKWDEATFSARINYRLDAAAQSIVFGGISQGFRAPNLSDLTRFDTARSNEVETPVQSLNSEDFSNYEIGVKHAGDKWSSQAAVYFTAIDGMIIRTPTGNMIDGGIEITKKNSGDGYVRGIELQTRYRMDSAWSLFGNLSWMDGEVDTYPTSAPVLATEPIDRLMPFGGVIGVNLDPEGAPWWIEGQLSFSAKADRLSTRDALDTDRIPPGGTPGHNIATLRGGWQLSGGLSISAALENIFDTDYRIHGSGLNEPGRNLIISLIWNP